MNNWVRKDVAQEAANRAANLVKGKVSIEFMSFMEYITDGRDPGQVYGKGKFVAVIKFNVTKNGEYWEAYANNNPLIAADKAIMHAINMCVNPVDRFIIKNKRILPRIRKFNLRYQKLLQQKVISKFVPNNQKYIFEEDLKKIY